MQRTKTREEIAEQVFLNVADIGKLLQVGYRSAKKIYAIADQIDTDQLRSWRIEPNKVRITTVCKVAGINLATLQKQIKSGVSGENRAASERMT